MECAAEDRVISAGESLGFTFTCGVSGYEIAAEKPSISFEVKREGSFVELRTPLFIDATELSVGTNRCSWTLDDSVSPGSYRLKFTYGSCVEYLNIIVAE